MIKVKKNFTDIPTILTQQSREDAFNANISSASYCDDKNRYKVASVQKKLNEIYHLKCAYCEQKLLDAPKHIEHYRPKDSYYWLAYSWDNLLLCCGSCNSAKGKRFATAKDAVVYRGECFTDIHHLGDSYDSLEEPKIINPEKENVLDFILFDKEGKMYSFDERVQHTIENACNLNRDELIQLRMKIITDFINRMNEHYLYFKKHKDISRFFPDIENFIQNCKVENEFYAFRYFVLNNIEIFFENNMVLQKIIYGRYKKYHDH
jgi:uncharacterized protein (TIGR02646 family)